MVCSCDDWEKANNERITSLGFFGTIDSVYLDPDGRMQPVAILNGGKYRVFNLIYQKFQKGDTLYKPVGTIKYYWIKNGDSILFYQQYGKYDLTDSGRVFNPYK